MGRRKKQLRMVTKDNLPVKIFEVPRRKPKYDIKKIAADLKQAHRSKVIQVSQTKSDIINKITIRSTKVPDPPELIVDPNPIFIDESSDEENDVSIIENIQITALLSPEVTHSIVVPVNVPVRCDATRLVTTSVVSESVVVKKESYSCDNVPEEFDCFVVLERLSDVWKPETPGPVIESHETETLKQEMLVQQEEDFNLRQRTVSTESSFDINIEPCHSMPTIDTPPPDKPLTPRPEDQPMVHIPNTDILYQPGERTVKPKIRVMPKLLAIQKKEPTRTSPEPPRPVYEAITPPLRPLIKLRNINDLLEKRLVPTNQLEASDRASRSSYGNLEPVINRHSQVVQDANMTDLSLLDRMVNRHISQEPRPPRTTNHRAILPKPVSRSTIAQQMPRPPQAIGNGSYSPQQFYYQQQQALAQNTQVQYQDGYYRQPPQQQPQQQTATVNYMRVNHGYPGFYGYPNQPVNIMYQNACLIESNTPMVRF